MSKIDVAVTQNGLQEELISRLCVALSVYLDQKYDKECQEEKRYSKESVK